MKTLLRLWPGMVCFVMFLSLNRLSSSLYTDNNKKTNMCYHDKQDFQVRNFSEFAVKMQIIHRKKLYPSSSFNTLIIRGLKANSAKQQSVHYHYDFKHKFSVNETKLLINFFLHGILHFYIFVCKIWGKYCKLCKIPGKKKKNGDNTTGNNNTQLVQ